MINRRTVRTPIGRTSEQDEQITAMKWLALKYPDVFKVTMAIPNEGKTSWYGGQRMKMAGVKAGSPDLLVCAARKGKHGLFIEMKSKQGKLRPNQQAMHELLRAQDYYVVTCYGAEDFIEVVEDYLE